MDNPYVAPVILIVEISLIILDASLITFGQYRRRKNRENEKALNNTLTSIEKRLQQLEKAGKPV